MACNPQLFSKSRLAFDSVWVDMRLKIFIYELPDPQAFLFSQVLPVTFPQFRNLPPELRDKIWKYAAPSNRPFYAYSNKYEKYSYVGGKSAAIYLQSRMRAPKILHINSESRAVGRKLYPLSLKQAKSDVRQYFSPTQDILVILNIDIWTFGFGWDIVAPDQIELFDKVLRLEIHNVSWTSGVPFALEVFNLKLVHPFAPSHFRALQQLILKVGVTSKHPCGSLLEETARNQCISFIEDLLTEEANNKNWFDYKVPEVKMLTEGGVPGLPLALSRRGRGLRTARPGSRFLPN